MKKTLAIAAILCASTTSWAEGPSSEVTPHTWTLTLHSEGIAQDDIMSRVTLSRTQIRAQLGAMLTDDALERYVRDRIHVDHDGERCTIIYYKTDPLASSHRDELGIFVRLSCEEEIDPAKLVVSSTLFAEQRHPIPLLFSMSSAKTRPPKLLARKTFDGTHTIYPEDARLSARPQRDASAKNMSVALLYALGTLAMLVLLGVLFYRWSTTTR